MGTLVLELFSNVAPKTVENFVNLCKNGYADTQVHRIVQNGWIQMGDTGSGSKGDGGHSSFPERYVRFGPDLIFVLSCLVRR